MPWYCYLLIALCALVVVFSIIFFSSKIKLIISYKNELTVYVKFLFWSKKLYSDKEKGKSSDGQDRIEETEDGFDLSIISGLNRYREILFGVLYDFLGKIQFRYIKLNIRIGTDNATKTALTYSLVAQGVSYLLGFLDGIATFKLSKKSSVDVIPNFLATESYFESTVVVCAGVIYGFNIIKNLSELFSKIRLDSEETKYGAN